MTEIIPFGKYRGQEIAQVMQRDPAYIQWLTQQAWFSEKFAPIYQLVVNNFAPPSEETPAHNALQVRFLEFPFQVAFWDACGIDNEVGWARMEEHFVRGTEELRKAPKPCRNRTYEWAIKEHRKRVQHHWEIWRCRHQKKRGRSFHSAQFEEVADVSFIVEMWVGFDKDVVAQHWTGRYNVTEEYSLFVEIKPSMSDDYPSVLRQIKRQRERAGTEGYRKQRWYLLVDQFSSQVVTLDQVRKIFKRDEIQIVMMDDVRDRLIGMRNENGGDE